MPSVDLKAFSRTRYITAVNQRWSGGGNIWPIKKMYARVTSYREGAVVSPVYDEAVHMQGDRRRLGVGGIVPGAVVLEKEEDNVEIIRNPPHPKQTCLFMILNFPFKSKSKSGHSSKCLTW